MILCKWRLSILSLDYQARPVDVKAILNHCHKAIFRKIARLLKHSNTVNKIKQSAVFTLYNNEFKLNHMRGMKEIKMARAAAKWSRQRSNRITAFGEMKAGNQ
jgi:lipopolysaccharide/colanic/teichoic acid biosynthesis glycosyltransferase